MTDGTGVPEEPTDETAPPVEVTPTMPLTERSAAVEMGGSVPSGPSAVEPEIWLAEDAQHTPARARHSTRRRLILVGVVVSVVAAFGVVAAGAFSRQQTVHTAFASLFGSPTLKVVFSAQMSDRHLEATVADYSVALTVTSENGSQPLSGSDSHDDFEVSVLRSGVDLGDFIVANGGVYEKFDLQAISPSEFRRAIQSMNQKIPAGPANAVAQAFLNDGWVGVDDATVASLVGGRNAKSAGSSFDSDRNAAALSFAQSWDMWASIHEVSSVGGTTEYSLNMPVREFVATFTQHLASALAKQVPSLRRDLGSTTSPLVRAIPASLTIPMTMWVSNGSLSQLDITYKGNSLDMAISHPTVGVSAPTGAAMVTPAIVTSLEDDYSGCSPDSSSSSAASCACVASSPPGGVQTSNSGGGFCSSGGFYPATLGLSFGLLEAELFGSCSISSIESSEGDSLTGLSGVSSASGWTGYSPLSTCGGGVTSSTATTGTGVAVSTSTMVPVSSSGSG